MSQQSDFFDFINSAVKTASFAGRPKVRTYSATMTSSSTTASASFPNSGAATITPIAVLVPSGSTAAVNAANIDIEQLSISVALVNNGSGTFTFDVVVGTASGFVGGSAQPIFPHDQGDTPSSLQFLQLPTSVGATAYKLTDIAVASPTSGLPVILTRQNFPGGKPIRLRAGQAEGLYVYVLNPTGVSFLNSKLVVAVTATWTES